MIRSFLLALLLPLFAHAQTKVSALPVDSTLDGSEQFYCVQGTGPGSDRACSAAEIKNFVVGAGSVAVASGKTVTVSNTLTLTGTDGSTLNMGAGGLLGTAAYTATTAYDAAGAAAAAQSASQPLDSDLTAIAALSTTSFGRALLALADAAAGRTALGLGALSTVTPGTGVATALGINIGSAGAPVVVNGAIGAASGTSLALSGTTSALHSSVLFTVNDTDNRSTWPVYFGGPVAGGQSAMTIDAWGAENVILARRFGGTKASPTALVSGDFMFNVAARGYDGNAVDAFGNASAYNPSAVDMKFYAAGNWTATSHPAMIRWSTTPVNGLAATDTMWLTEKGQLLIGAPGGGFVNTPIDSNAAIQVTGEMLISDVDTPNVRWYRNGVVKGFDGVGNGAAFTGHAAAGDRFIRAEQQLILRTGGDAAGIDISAAGVATFSGAIVAPSFNGNTFTSGTYTLTGAAGKTLTFDKSIELDGTDGTKVTLPSTNSVMARTDAGQTFTGNQVVNGNITFTDNTYDIGASGATRPRTGYFATSVDSPLYSGTSGTISLANVVLISSGRLRLRSDVTMGFSSGTEPVSTASDTTFSRISAGVMGVGTGTTGSVAGTISGALALFNTHDRATAGALTIGGTATSLVIPTATVTSAGSGTRFLCISTAGVVTSSASACSGT